VILFFLLIAAFNTLLYGFFNGIIFGVLADGQKKEAQVSADQKHHSEMRQKVIAIVGNRVVYGILNGLLDGIFVGLIVNPVSVGSVAYFPAFSAPLLVNWILK